MKDKPLVSVIIPTYNRKEKLIRLIQSIKRSSYPENKIEIIVVDDASTDGTSEEIRRLFPSIKFLRNRKRLLTAGSRNVGLRNARGKYFFLIDDDNVIDENCIKELVRVAKNNASIGIVAPIMYYLKQPNRIWCAGIRRSMITSLTTYIGRDEFDNGQFGGLVESNDFPNAFMIKREVIEKVGPLNEKEFPIQYEEADLGERVRRAGYAIVCNPKARVWHDIPLPEDVREKARLFHVHEEFRAYYAGRNRILFHRKYSNWWQFLIFILVFNWLLTLYYLGVILVRSNSPIWRKIAVAKKYIQGVKEGLFK
ncbi:MAG: glycosyltransferase family 2 protein [Candidatus Jordarchaeaceae archaeon]